MTGTPQKDTAALYMPPRGEQIYGLSGYTPYNCTIVSVPATGVEKPLVDAFVRAPSGTGSYSAWIAERVPYVDATTDPADVPANGGYVAPVGFTIPQPPTPAQVKDANGQVIYPNQTIWYNPDTTPTTTTLNSPVVLPYS